MEPTEPSGRLLGELLQGLVVSERIAVGPSVISQEETRKEVKVSRFSICSVTGGKHIPSVSFYCKACGCKIAF